MTETGYSELAFFIITSPLRRSCRASVIPPNSQNVSRSSECTAIMTSGHLPKSEITRIATARNSYSLNLDKSLYKNVSFHTSKCCQSSSKNLKSLPSSALDCSFLKFQNKSRILELSFLNIIDFWGIKIYWI